MGESPETWFSLIPGLKSLPPHVAGALFVAVLLWAGSLLVFRGMKRQRAVVPEERLTLRNICEILVEYLADLADDVIGHEGRKYVPLVGSLFLFILCSNLMGLIPGFIPPTMNISTNAACAITAFIAYNYYGFKEHGAKYLNQFVGPFLPIAIVFLPAEIFSQVFRPVTLSLRLFANMFADHQVIGAFERLIPVLVPVPFIFLGLFVAILQAFVFTLLTMVYISLAVSHEH